MIPNWYIEDMSKKAIQSSGLFLFSAVLSLFLMTCSNQNPISENPNILRIGTPDRVQSANIFLDSHLSMLAHIANPPLMKIDHEGRLTGQLLRDIRVSDDFKFWSLTVDDNLYWSDGRKMTAEDIQFSILYTKENYPAAGWLNEVVEEVTIEDSGQVHVRLNKPYTRLDFELATHKILPKHIWSNIPDPMKYTNPKVNVGCGPFLSNPSIYQRASSSSLKIHTGKEKDLPSRASRSISTVTRTHFLWPWKRVKWMPTTAMPLPTLIQAFRKSEKPAGSTISSI